MVTPQLIKPESIVIIGGSNDIHKPGGKVLKNLVDGGFQGELFVLNPKETKVQGIVSYSKPEDLPNIDLAIFAIAAKYTLPLLEFLAEHRSTKAFIILSAGFSEESEEGKVLEKKLVDVANKNKASLIGPNCVGVLTPYYNGVFTEPIPTLNSKGCDFISGSGATACFIMEAGIPKGLSFANVFTVGNSAQLGVEEILEYLDEVYEDGVSARTKLLYIETVSKPAKLLKHARSLIKKGCKIAAIKAGSSDAGSRAASSHTGAMASPDVAVDALFRKAGIVRCFGREDLIAVASVFAYPSLPGKRIAIITHAGGPAVMLTDALSTNGLEVPPITHPKAQELLEKLYPGSSVTNPIDFLATGTAIQLESILDFTDKHFDDIDAMAVIFGTPGLSPIFDVYEVLSRKIKTAGKPIYPILPSTLTAHKEIEKFIEQGLPFFPDEVIFGQALAKVHRITESAINQDEFNALDMIDHIRLRDLVESLGDGYVSPEVAQEFLDAVGIPRAKEIVISKNDQLQNACTEVGFPLVMKVVGPVHKSDVGGVRLNIKTYESAQYEFDRMMGIPETTGILLQPMLSGSELFVGVKREDGFGHLIMCGIGGIFIEVFKDVSVGLHPLQETEIIAMIQSIKGYPIIQGIRGSKGVNEAGFVDVIQRVSALIDVVPEIAEMDINPLLGNEESVVAVDVRISLEKSRV